MNATEFATYTEKLKELSDDQLQSLTFQGWVEQNERRYGEEYAEAAIADGNSISSLNISEWTSYGEIRGI